MKFSLYDLQKKELLGSGVSGQVYFSTHKLKKKNFALKIIPLKDDLKLKTLIENEVKILHSCKCDNIIKCYASYFDEGAINILLEFMDKKTLADFLSILKAKKIKKIPEKILGVILFQILLGLDYLHSNKRVVHRDIKPSNILLNSKGIVKISDFGVSSIVTDSIKGKETLVGTYNYMSPERIKLNNYSFVSDVWSVGLCILESALGKYPYLFALDSNNKDKEKDQENTNNLKADLFWNLQKIIDEVDLPLGILREEYSKDFENILGKMLEKNPLKRMNAKELLKMDFFKDYSELDYKDLAKWILENC